MEQLLSNVPNGQNVLVKNVSASDLRVKLLEMGIVEGKELKVLFRAPLGDPIAVDVEGYVLSLRVDEAKLISVESNEIEG